MQLDFEFKIGNNKEYKINVIWDSTVYSKKLITNKLSIIYYLILWKSYPKKENIWEPALMI